MLDDHVHQLELPDEGPVLFFELFPLLCHELLNVVILLVRHLDLIVNLGQLLPSVFNLLLQRQILLVDVLHLDHLLT